MYDPEIREALRAEAALARAERDRPSLHQLTDEINARLEQLDKLFHAYGDRLEPVLTPSRPHPPVEVPPDRTDDGSWLADYLTATARRLDATIEAFGALLTRVDL